jgi:predicted Zn-dependent protease
MDQRFKSVALAVDSYRKAGEPSLAARAAERYVDMNPTNLSYIRQATQLYLQANEPEEALRIADAALERNPLSPELNELKFNILADAGRNEEAVGFGKYLLVLDTQMASREGGLFDDAMSARIRQRVEALSTSPERQPS